MDAGLAAGGKRKKEIEARKTDATTHNAMIRRAPNNFNEGGAQNHENQTTLGPRHPKPQIPIINPKS